MIDYINSLIAVMIVCQIAVSLAPGSDSAVRSIRLICAAVALLTLLSPIGSVVSFGEELVREAGNIISANNGSSVGSVEAADTFEIVAAQIVGYVSETYDVGEIDAVLLTDDTDSRAVELQLYIKNCPYTRRAQLEVELNERLGFPVYVMCD